MTIDVEQTGVQVAIGGVGLLLVLLAVALFGMHGFLAACALVVLGLIVWLARTILGDVRQARTSRGSA